ncbi:MAG: histidine kinase [Rhizobium sp.]|nr:histidine kinase [Rhizobium sp.]MBX9458980.1 histidine kinase [Rhizobium sp.]
MKFASAVTAAYLLLAGTAMAGEIQFPSDEPVASITFPDGWGEKETESGIDATSPDNSIYLAVDVAEPKDTTQTVTDAVEWLKGLGVTVDAGSAKEVEGTLNGMQVFNIDWDGTDKDGPVSISLAAVALAEKVLVVTYWGTKGEQESNGAAMNAIINSLKPVE